MSREIGQSRWYPWMINGALLVLALVSLAPLLWMVSVSFMPQGEASHFPPPLLPSSVTTHNYHELFARTGMGGNFANSLLVSLGQGVSLVPQWPSLLEQSPNARILSEEPRYCRDIVLAYSAGHHRTSAIKLLASVLMA